MMKNILIYLKQLDFSEIESKLYLLLLRSGPLTVAELAEAAKINRTATYSHIESLLKKGIIAKIRGASNKIAANPPEHLRYLVQQKISTIKSLELGLPSIITTLNASLPQAKADSSSDMKYYKGRSGAKAIYEECLNAKELRSYFNAADISRIFPENTKLFDDAFIYNQKIRMFEIVESSPESHREIERHKRTDRYFYKFLPDDIELTSNDILIYDGKVAIINIGDKDNVTGVVLSNRDYYNNSVQLFDLLWRMLPEPSV